MTEHTHRHSSTDTFPFGKWLLIVGALIIAALLISAVSSNVQKPFTSSEVHFTDASASGLQIVPASCPSDPHYAGQCSEPPLPPPTPPSGTCVIYSNPESIANGQSTTLAWSTANLRESFISIPPSGATISPTVGAVNRTGTTLVSPTQTTTYTLSGSYVWNGRTEGTFSCTSTVTVVSVLPDLVTLNTTQGGGVINISKTLTAKVTNQGNSSTGSDFENFFQVASLPNGGGTISDRSPVLLSTVASGASGNISRSYTFTSVGTYSVRACADKSSASDTGTIVESNEGNNCSAWVNVVVTEGTCPLGSAGTYPTCLPTGSDITTSFQGRGCVLPVGGGSCNITSYWTVTGLPTGETVNLDVIGPGIAYNYQKLPTTLAEAKTAVRSTLAFVYGALLPTRASTNPYPVPVSQPGQFNLRLLRSNGTQLGAAIALVACPPGNTIEIVGGVEVCVAPPTQPEPPPFVSPPSVITWSVRPVLVRQGTPVQVTWAAENAQSCTVRGTNSDGSGINATGLWNTTTGVKATSLIRAQTVYTITCQGFAGASPSTVTRSTTVNILPAFQEQ